MNVLIGNDYNLEQFYMFEPYFFVTSDKWIACHPRHSEGWSTHFYQCSSDGDIRYPHIHVMYTKRPRKKNEPQNWIIEHCTEVNNDIS